MNSNYEDLLKKGIPEMATKMAKVFAKIGQIENTYTHKILSIPNIIHFRGDTTTILDAVSRGFARKMKEINEKKMAKEMGITPEQFKEFVKLRGRQSEIIMGGDTSPKDDPNAPYGDDDYTRIIDLAKEGSLLVVSIGSDDFPYQDMEVFCFEFFGRSATVGYMAENSGEIAGIEGLGSGSADVGKTAKLRDVFDRLALQAQLEYSISRKKNTRLAAEDFTSMVAFFDLVIAHQEEFNSLTKNVVSDIQNCKGDFNYREFADRRGPYMKLFSDFSKQTN